MRASMGAYLDHCFELFFEIEVSRGASQAKDWIGIQPPKKKSQQVDVSPVVQYRSLSSVLKLEEEGSF